MVAPHVGGVERWRSRCRFIISDFPDFPTSTCRRGSIASSLNVLAELIAVDFAGNFRHVFNFGDDFQHFMSVMGLRALAARFASALSRQGRPVMLTGQDYPGAACILINYPSVFRFVLDSLLMLTDLA